MSTLRHGYTLEHSAHAKTSYGGWATGLGDSLYANVGSRLDGESFVTYGWRLVCRQRRRELGCERWSVIH